MRHFVTVVCGMAAVSAGLVGCSGGKGAPTANGGAVSYSGGAPAQTNDATVVVDGQPHKINGGTACTVYADETVIAVGREPNSVKLRLTNGDKPTAKSVILGNIVGFNLFVDPPEHGAAKVAKEGKKYTVTGTAWGVNTASSNADEVTKPFEVQLSYP